MKKISLLFMVITALASTVKAQSYTSTVSYNKANQPALVLQLPYSEEVAEGYIVSNLKKTGFDPETKGKLFWKKNKVDGYYIFKGVVLDSVATPLDLYFKVDRRSKKLKDQSTISMLVSRGDENFVTDADETTYAAARRFLNSFVSGSAAYKVNLDVEVQEGVVKSAEKKLTNLKDDEQDLIKKIEGLQNDLRNNRSDQEKQQRAIEDERKKLAELKTKVQTF
jgi:hypothetical protein